MAKMPSREVRAARWIEFAEFMESLPEHKFNHNNWCRPDHTCKTTACVAGWGAIKYTEQAKEWLDTTFEIQKMYSNKDYHCDLDKLWELKSKARKLDPDKRLFSSSEAKKSWEQLGRKGLYLAVNTSLVLFYPDNDFWDDVFGEATNKDIALVFRYMATFHGRLGKKFNRERMQKVVDAYNMPSANA